MPIATWKREQIARRPQSAGKKVNGYAWEQSHADTVSRREPDLAAHVAADADDSERDECADLGAWVAFAGVAGKIRT